MAKRSLLFLASLVSPSISRDSKFRVEREEPADTGNAGAGAEQRREGKREGPGKAAILSRDAHSSPRVRVDEKGSRMNTFFNTRRVRKLKSSAPRPNDQLAGIAASANTTPGVGEHDARRRLASTRDSEPLSRDLA